MSGGYFWYGLPLIEQFQCMSTFLFLIWCVGSSRLRPYSSHAWRRRKRKKVNYCPCTFAFFSSSTAQLSAACRFSCRIKKPGRIVHMLGFRCCSLFILFVCRFESRWRHVCLCNSYEQTRMPYSKVDGGMY